MAFTEAQKAIRASGIGASEIGAIVGVNPYESALGVWLKKTGRCPDEPDNEQMAAGRYLEPVVLQMFADRTGHKIITPQNYWPSSENGTLVHPDAPWVFATPDGVGVDPTGEGNEKPTCVVEAKATGAYNSGKWRDPSDAPPYYLLQNLYQMEVSGVHCGYLVGLIGGQDLKVRPVPWDEEKAAWLVRAATAFWFDFVVPDIQPPVDGSDRWRAWHAEKCSSELGAPILPTEEIERLVEDILDLRASKDEADIVLSLKENQLQHLIGSASECKGPGWRCYWQNGSKTTAWKEVALELCKGKEKEWVKELLEKHTSKGNQRKFMLAKTKER